jgi:hypothetical protein
LGNPDSSFFLRNPDSSFFGEILTVVLYYTTNIRSSSTSVAKYCAKRVPTGCSVLAVNNGKIIYHRDAGRAMEHELYQTTSTSMLIE